MEDIDSSPVLPDVPLNTRKRTASDEDTSGNKPLNLTGGQFIIPTPPDTEKSSNASPSAAGIQQRPSSPAPSVSTLTSVDISINTAPDSTTLAPLSGGKLPPAKRRKLMPSEKIEKAREKEARDREKAEKKLAKEEERRVKEEEKRVKDEEKRRKAEDREAKKREKDLEERRKEESKLKKERSQMRLGAFFIPKPETPATAGEHTEGAVSTGRQLLPLEPHDAVSDLVRTFASPSKGAQQEGEGTPDNICTPARPIKTDYEKYFLPFELPSKSHLAERFIIEDPDDLAYWQGAFDAELQDPSFKEKVDLGLIEPTAIVDHMFKGEGVAERGYYQPNLKALVEAIDGTSTQPIDLTADGKSSEAPTQVLQRISHRHIQFEEDVRPAYCGTYTKVRSPQTIRKIMLNPFSRARPDTDYEYDSEAEWEEPGEGEDLLGDEEEEAESLGDADEMDAFLDDEEDTFKNRRKLITTDLQPAYSGMYWENETGVIVQSIDGEKVFGTPKELHGTRLGFLIPGFSGQTIDPFSTVYWASTMAPPDVPITDFHRSTITGLLLDVRPPLQERHSNTSVMQSVVGAAEGEKGPITAVTTAQCPKRGPKVQPKTLSKEDLDEFKEAVVGSNLKKSDLLKALKQRYVTECPTEIVFPISNIAIRVKLTIYPDSQR